MQFDIPTQPPYRRKYVLAHSSFEYYKRHIKPGVSAVNSKKQVGFAIRVKNRWGLPRAKYLWIHYDEKWFYAVVARNNGKACPEKGVRKSFSSVHHKSHVEKVMCVAVACYAFDGDVEDGGEGVKITPGRCQAAKIAARMQWEMHTNSSGKRTANKQKPPLREALDTWFVDVSVTGSDEGDSKDPKFSMKSYFMLKVYNPLTCTRRNETHLRVCRWCRSSRKWWPPAHDLRVTPQSYKVTTLRGTRSRDSPDG